MLASQILYLGLGTRHDHDRCRRATSLIMYAIWHRACACVCKCMEAIDACLHARAACARCLELIQC